MHGLPSPKPWLNARLGIWCGGRSRSVGPRGKAGHAPRRYTMTRAPTLKEGEIEIEEMTARLT